MGDNNTSKEIIKTHCFNCDRETNQDSLFNDSEIGPQEIIWRNEKGDDSQSAWAIVANIWNLSKCRGCEKINFKHIVRSSPDRNSDQVFNFPRKPIRQIPNWVIKLPIKYVGILQEVYVSINEQLFTLSLTGIRTLLDIYIVDKIGDAGNFKDKLKKLVSNGIITQSKASVLEVAIDAGNASAHRGYRPDKETLFQVLDIIENLLQSEIVDRPVEKIKQNTPKRQ
jgi:uncharacterized protein YutE (UPF0331/DUF86 family)